jgi:hypothetical protein
MMNERMLAACRSLLVRILGPVRRTMAKLPTVWGKLFGLKVLPTGIVVPEDGRVTVLQSQEAVTLEDYSSLLASLKKWDPALGLEPLEKLASQVQGAGANRKLLFPMRQYGGMFRSEAAVHATWGLVCHMDLGGTLAHEGKKAGSDHILHILTVPNEVLRQHDRDRSGSGTGA